jgi:hypothetical protein
VLDTELFEGARFSALTPPNQLSLVNRHEAPSRVLHALVSGNGGFVAVGSKGPRRPVRLTFKLFPPSGNGTRAF